MDFGVGTLLTIFVLTSIFALWYRWRKRQMSYFARIGIPGPPPHLIYGNLPEVGQKGPLVTHLEWVQKYGKVVGYYFGGQPVLLAADPDLVKLILVKEFSSFSSRTPPLAGSFLPHQYVWQSIPMVNGQRWKITRNILSPIYSAIRMKWMAKQVDDAVTLTTEVIKDKVNSRTPFDIYKSFQGLSLDITTRPNLGIRTNSQKDRNDPLLQSMLETLSYRVKGPIMMLTACFPELSFIAVPLRILEDRIKYWRNKPSTLLMLKQCKEIIDSRKKENQHRQPDMLKLMLEDKVSLEKLYGKLSEAEIKDIDEKSRFMKPEEMWATTAIVLMAGYETMSLALAFTFLFLVNHQDIQDKAREEARRVIKSRGGLDYDAVTELTYIEQVMNESLRIFPVVNGFTFREALNDVHFGDMLIPKGTICQISVEYLHRSPDYWPDPMKFDPDRFAPCNKANIDPYIFQPFGVGPRHCLGKRFAEFSVKLAIARLLNTYKFLPCEDTPDINDVDFKLFQIFPKNGATIKVVPLDS